MTAIAIVIVYDILLNHRDYKYVAEINENVFVLMCALKRLYISMFLYPNLKFEIWNRSPTELI